MNKGIKRDKRFLHNKKANNLFNAYYLPKIRVCNKETIGFTVLV
jgi:hypothetical protein